MVYNIYYILLHTVVRSRPRLGESVYIIYIYAYVLREYNVTQRERGGKKIHYTIIDCSMPLYRMPKVPIHTHTQT